MSAFRETDSLPRVPSATPAARLMAVLVPLLFGCYSLWLGADSNWDLHNYHLYAPFAFLHDKLRTDLGAASFQGYFNPLLDVVFYQLNTHLPPRVVGFLIGAFHGLAFVLLLGIARRVLGGLSDADRRRLPVWLALAGCLTANFLSGLGNTMGDDTTAVLCLAGVALLIARWATLGTGRLAGLGASFGGGLLIGFAAGFKLTNAVFAVAACAALVIAVRGGALARLRAGFVFGVGVLAGFAATGGYWMWRMWHTFGNPLFPQFSAFFPNPLVRTLSISDTRWLPHGLLETVLWPFVISLHSHRVGEVGIRQVIWAIVNTLGVIWAVRAVLARFSAAGRAERLDPRAAFVIAYVAIGFALWTKLFSIYRYLVPVEVLAPLVVYVLLTRLTTLARARRRAAWLLGVATAVVVTGGAGTWGHEPWTDPLYHAELPPLADPAHATVLLVTAEQPRAWLATLFPAEVAFVGIDVGFPEGPGYMPRVHDMVAQRGGPVYALLGSASDWRGQRMAKLDATLRGLGVTGGERGCAMLSTLVTRLHLHARVVPAASDASARCSLGMRADDVQDIGAENRAIVSRMDAVLQTRGFTIVPGSCAKYDAGMGAGSDPYQFCRVETRH